MVLRGCGPGGTVLRGVLSIGEVFSEGSTPLFKDSTSSPVNGQTCVKHYLAPNFVCGW